MKKHGLAKILAILLLLIVIISYVVEGRQGISYIALGDVLINYFQSFYYFFDTALFILFVGGFYGVLDNLEAYKKFQENIVAKIKRPRLSIIIIICTVSILSSLTGLNLLLLIFIPFLISLILTMGYDKIVALLSTVGATVTGLMGGIFVTFRDPTNYYGTSYTTFESFVGLDSNYANILPKIILLVLSTALLIFCVCKYIKKNSDKLNIESTEENKKEKELAKEEILEEKKDEEKIVKEKVERKEEKNTSKKEVKQNNTSKKEVKQNNTSKKQPTKKNNNTKKKVNKNSNLSAAKKEEKIVIKPNKKERKLRTWPLLVILILVFVLLVLGYMPWNSLFEITIFDDFHNWLIGISIKEYTIFNNLISSNFSAFGSWGSLGNYLMAMVVIVIFTIILKFIYRIKFNDLLDNFKEGMKKMLPSAAIAMLAYTVLVCTYNNGFVETIIKSASESLSDNFMIHSLITILGSITNVDFYYTAAGVFSPIASSLSEKANLNVFALAFQSLYSLVQLVGPTSLLLIVTLTYEEVPYKNWLKNIWRLALEILIVIFITLLIMSML